MSKGSAIEWTDSSWNPIRARRRLPDGKVLIGWHCTHASEGCRNCYAEGFNLRLGTKLPYKPGHERDIEIYLDEKMLVEPLRWVKPQKIFVGSMTDIFADFVTDAWLDQLFAVMALCPQHVFQVLTKRPERMRAYFEGPSHFRHPRYLGRGREIAIDEVATPLAFKINRDRPASRWVHSPFGGCEAGLPLPNVWLGTSVEDQATAGERIPHLLVAPAAVRFLSCEPLLGVVDLTEIDLAQAEALEKEPSGLISVDALTGLHADGEGLVDGVYGTPDPHIDWVICGGESGAKARPMHPDWARGLRDQCAEAGVPFFFKQWGEWGADTGPGAEIHPDGNRRDRVMEGAGPCAVLVNGTWQLFQDGYEPPIELCAGHGEFVYRLGKKRNGRLLDGAEHNGMPV